MSLGNLGLTGSEIYIYGFGVAGKWLSSNLDGNIVGFIDTDEKKVGRSINDIPVYSIEQAQQRLTENSDIVVTVVDIQDVIPVVDKLPHKQWVSLGVNLNDTKVTINPTPEKNSFVEYTLKTVEDCHKAYFSNTGLFLRSIDLVITEKCSLKCKDCSNLMQYFESPVNIEYDELVRDFDNLTRSVAHIHEVRLIGGEPFMNKDIYKILKYISDSPKVSLIVIYSNAMIPVKSSEAEIVRHPKIVFSLTDYGDLAKNTPKIVQSLDEMGVTYRLHPPENWTDSGAIQEYNRTPAQLETLFSDCCGKHLLTVTDGKLYRCPFAANAERLKAVPRDPANSVAVDAGKEEILHYTTAIPYLPACNYCKGRSFGAPEIEPAIQAAAPIPYRKYL